MGEGMADLVRAHSRAYRKGSSWQTKDKCMRVVRPLPLTLAERWRVLCHVARVCGTHAP